MNKRKLIITESERETIKSMYDLTEQLDALKDIAKTFKMFSDGGEGFKEYLEKILSGDYKKDGNSDEMSDVIKKTDELIKDTNTTDDNFYEKILNCLGAKPTKGNMAFLYAWRQSEGATAANNPFNTTMKMGSTSNYNSHGVKNYRSIDQGIEATCKTLRLPYYRDIVSGLKDDVGLYELSRMKSLEKWGTGDLVAKVADGYLSGNTPKPKPINKGRVA